MFTGLIEARTTVVSLTPHAGGQRLILRSIFDDVSLGESIAVNGVCLTALGAQKGQLAFDLSEETLMKTHLGALSTGQCVNLERAMLPTTRFGGHYVSGHVDGVTSIQQMNPVGDYVALRVGPFSVEEQRFLVPKGSITLDGISLTINQVSDGFVDIMLVPHTCLKTTLEKAQVGDKLHVEFDYIARLVAHQLGSFVDSTIMSSFLRTHHDTEV